MLVSVVCEAAEARREAPGHFKLHSTGVYVIEVLIYAEIIFRIYRLINQIVNGVVVKRY